MASQLHSAKSHIPLQKLGEFLILQKLGEFLIIFLNLHNLCMLNFTDLGETGFKW